MSKTILSHFVSRSTKYCACHEKWARGIWSVAPATWNHHHVQKQVRRQFHKMRNAVQVHQILRLPHKMTSKSTSHFDPRLPTSSGNCLACHAWSNPRPFTLTIRTPQCGHIVWGIWTNLNHSFISFINYWGPGSRHFDFPRLQTLSGACRRDGGDVVGLVGLPVRARCPVGGLTWSCRGFFDGILYPTSTVKNGILWISIIYRIYRCLFWGNGSKDWLKDINKFEINWMYLDFTGKNS